MAYLIDTSVFSTLERRDLSLDALAAIVVNEPAALTSITASELLLGVHRAEPAARRERRRAVVEEFIEAFDVIPFDLEIARVHAQLSADLAAVGRKIGANDLLIAATALAHGLLVMTENIRDFERVPGLVVHRPDWQVMGNG